MHENEVEATKWLKMLGNGARKQEEEAKLAAERARLEEELQILRGKAERVSGKLSALCHRKTGIAMRFSARKLGPKKVSKRCEECGVRFITKTKAAKFCLSCKKKRRTRWFQLTGGKRG